MVKQPLVVNFFGGPGAGKSTMAAHVFAELKWYTGRPDTPDIKVELVTEYAKDKVWEDSLHTLDNQPYVFGKQLHRLSRVANKVDIVITDSPIILSLLYSNEGPKFANFVVDKFDSFFNYNVLLRRKKVYIKAGRYQEEEDARKLDAQTTRLLLENNIQIHSVYDGVRENVPEIVRDTLIMKGIS